MTIYKEKRKHGRFYQRLYEKHYGPIPVEPNGRKYEIHHIDGDYTNNDPKNLIAVTCQEHFDIHKKQGDYRACILIGIRLKMNPEDIRQLQRNAALKRVNDGSHHLLKRGPAHPKYDHTIYELTNIQTGETITGTRQELMSELGWSNDNIAKLINRKKKTCRGWKLS